MPSGLIWYRFGLALARVTPGVLQWQICVRKFPSLSTVVPKPVASPAPMMPEPPSLHPVIYKAQPVYVAGFHQTKRHRHRRIPTKQSCVVELSHLRSLAHMCIFDCFFTRARVHAQTRIMSSGCCFRRGHQQKTRKNNACRTI